MPMYEYQCQDCGLRFEVRQKFSDAPIDSCSSCGGQARKMISRTGFALKGGGWFDQGYATEGSCAASATSQEKSPACQSCPKAANA